MRCNCFGLRILTLCLTFWLGILAADWFRAAQVQQVEETKSEETKRVIVAHDPKEINHDSVKPRCKKFFGNFDIEIIDEQLVPLEKQTKVRISKKIKANREEIKARKVEEEALKLFEKLEDAKRETEKTRPESGIAHNLLYIENCAEYY